MFFFSIIYIYLYALAVIVRESWALASIIFFCSLFVKLNFICFAFFSISISFYYSSLQCNFFSRMSLVFRLFFNKRESERASAILLWGKNSKREKQKKPMLLSRQFKELLVKNDENTLICDWFWPIDYRLTDWLAD